MIQPDISIDFFEHTVYSVGAVKVMVKLKLGEIKKKGERGELNEKMRRRRTKGERPKENKRGRGQS